MAIYIYITKSQTNPKRWDFGILKIPKSQTGILTWDMFYGSLYSFLTQIPKSQHLLL